MPTPHQRDQELIVATLRDHDLAAHEALVLELAEPTVQLKTRRTSVPVGNSKIGGDENTPTTPMPADVDPYTLVPQHQGQYYGALKTFAEKEVEKHYPGINTIIRPGLIVGPLDPSDRFT